MRVSTNQMHMLGVNSMLNQQAQLNKTQLQLSSGKRILSPADDPSASKQILNLNQIVSAAEQHQRNADAAESRLAQEESAIKGVVNVLQRVRELTLSANNGSFSDQDRRTVAAEASQKLEELVALANSQDSNGSFLFAGFQVGAEPFSKTGAGVSYSGDDGQQYLQIGPGRQIAVGDSGADVFMAIKNGNGTFAVSADGGNTGSGVIETGSVLDRSTWQANLDTYSIVFTDPTTYEVRDSGAPPAVISTGTYQSGQAIEFLGVRTAITGTPAAGDQFAVAPSTSQSIFESVQNVVDALSNPVGDAAGRAQLATSINRAIIDIDQSMNSVLEVQSSIGARMNAIDSQRAINDDLSFQGQKVLSATEDVDIAEATTRLNKQMVSLQAAQQAYVRVQGLSLFDYLR